MRHSEPSSPLDCRGRVDHTIIRAFVVDNFLFGQPDAALDDAASFLDAGIIDSTGVLELVAFLEETYGIVIDDNDLIPGNLDSISLVAEFVGRKLDVDGIRRAG